MNNGSSEMISEFFEQHEYNDVPGLYKDYLLEIEQKRWSLLLANM